MIEAKFALLLSILSASPPAADVPPGDRRSFELPIAQISRVYRKRIYSCELGAGPCVVPLHCSWHDTAAKRSGKFTATCIHHSSHFDHAFRWAVGHGYYWMSFVFEPEAIVDPPLPKMRLLRVPIQDMDGDVHKNLSEAGRYGNVFLANPISALYDSDSRQKRYPKPISEQGRLAPFYYDFVPISGEEVILFVQRRPKRVIEMVKIKVRPRLDPLPAGVTDPNQPLHPPEHYFQHIVDVDVSFCEDFQCHMDGSGCVYFITRTGGVHVAPKPLKGRRVAMPVSLPNSFRIAGMIKDVDSGQGWLVGRPKNPKDENVEYLDLANTRSHLPRRIQSSPQSKDADVPVRMIELTRMITSSPNKTPR